MAIIKIKSGTGGAPPADSLAIGELALDRDNKRLFTSTDGSAITWIGAQIESSPSDWTSSTKLATQSAIDARLKPLGSSTAPTTGNIKTGSNVWTSGLYNYHVYSTNNSEPDAPTRGGSGASREVYGAVIGFGKGSYGSAELFSTWVANSTPALFLRTLADNGGTWGSWNQVLTLSDTTLSPTFASVKIKESGGGSDTITLAAPSINSSYTLTLPTTAGTNGYALTTDGSGTLSWSTINAGTVTTNATTTGTFYPILVNSSNPGSVTAYVDSGISFDAETDELTVSNLAVNGAGITTTQGSPNLFYTTTGTISIGDTSDSTTKVCGLEVANTILFSLYGSDVYHIIQSNQSWDPADNVTLYGNFAERRLFAIIDNQDNSVINLSVGAQEEDGYSRLIVGNGSIAFYDIAPTSNYFTGADDPRIECNLFNGSSTGLGGTITKTVNIATAGGQYKDTIINIGTGNNTNSSLTSVINLRGNTTVTGDLTVNGTMTTINSNVVTVDDKNLTLGSVASFSGVTATLYTGTAVVTVSSTAGMIPGQTLTKTGGTGAFGTSAKISTVDSATQFTATVNHGATGAITFTVGGATDVTAQLGGITLKGTTDKTILWDSDYWSLSENLNIASGKVFAIDGNIILSESGVLGLSVSSGTISSGTWNGTAIGTIYGGTGLTSYATGDVIVGVSSNTLGKLTKPTSTGDYSAYLLSMTSAGTAAWKSPSELLYLGTISGGTEDFDNYTTTGRYTVGLNNWTGTYNTPVMAYSYGELQITAASHTGSLVVTQIYYPDRTQTGVWTRSKFGGSWGDWQRFLTTNITDVSSVSGIDDADKIWIYDNSAQGTSAVKWKTTTIADIFGSTSSTTINGGTYQGS